jgi:hypothetical protein
MNIGQLADGFVQIAKNQTQIDRFTALISEIMAESGPITTLEVKEKPRVLLGLPRGGFVSRGTDMAAMVNGSDSLAYDVMTVDMPSESLLCNGFNKLLCYYLNDPTLDYFMMLHGDVEPHGPFIDVMIDEASRGQFQVFHAVCALKDYRALTSTGLGDMDDKWEHRRRISIHELIDTLPDTFSLEELLEAYGEVPDHPCMIPNTGCMLMQGREWIEKFALDHAFHMKDRIVLQDGIYSAQCIPEDWGLGFWCAENGIKVGGTKKIKIDHHGSAAYANHYKWGAYTRDEQYFKSIEGKKNGRPVADRS